MGDEPAGANGIGRVCRGEHVRLHNQPCVGVLFCHRIEAAESVILGPGVHAASSALATSCVSVRCAWSLGWAHSTRRSGRRSPQSRTHVENRHSETLRTWIRRSEVDTGQRPGVTTQIAEENKALRKEIAELRRANEILKAAAIFFGAELDRPGRR